MLLELLTVKSSGANLRLWFGLTPVFESNRQSGGVRECFEYLEMQIWYVF